MLAQVTTMKKIVITSGEPAGIGPDICLSLPEIKNTELYIIADPTLMTERIQKLKKSNMILKSHLSWMLYSYLYL